MVDIKLGPLTFIYWMIGLVMTGALLFMGIMSWEEIRIPFFLFFVVPALFTMAGTRIGVTKQSVFSPNTFLAVVVSVLVLFLNVYLLKGMFGYSVEARFESVLVAVLFAIYEETLFLGVATLILATPINPFYALLVADMVFVGLHALRYPETLFYDLFLVIGRTVMTGALILTKNSDVPMTTHVLYNLITSWGR